MSNSSAEFQKKQLIPLGIDDFKEIISEKYLYIDKTLLIKEFWDDKAKVTLVTRPRRFGKTIVLSMLRYFFEKTETSHAYLFENSNIWKHEEFRNILGTFPVISITFKDVKYNTWEKSYAKLKSIIKLEVSRNLTPFLSLLLPEEKLTYNELMNFTQSLDENQLLINFTDSLKFITQVLERVHQKKTIILIDEYDTPITYGYSCGLAP